MEININKATLYNDFNQFDSLRQDAKHNNGKALPKVAKQFEAIFIQSLLKGMRQANQFISKDNPFSNSKVEFFQDMLDKQMSTVLSNQKGIGLAAMMVKQMSNLVNAAPDVHVKDAQVDRNIKENDFNIRKFLSQVKHVADTHGMNIKQNFINKLTPLAKIAGEKLGVEPKLLIAQAALETGWGKHVIKSQDGNSSFNLFNIKDHQSNAESIEKNAVEYSGEVAQTVSSQFKKYQNFSESFNDYVNFIQNNPRYQKALEHVSDPKRYIHEIQKAGYATDPNYAQKVIDIYDGLGVRKTSNMDNKSWPI